ncbi:MAG: dynamin family protein [Deltaproteobacteria bacterium]|nr:dynamin family protein [Deltaproteobacteria bacterium]
MGSFESVKADLLQITRKCSSLFKTAKSIPGLSTFSFDGWEKAGRTIGEQINEDMLRVAVVGAIKSGKSTFVNAILEGDYLKRGAGVVTSIVTRVRKGSILKANLIFKTWKEVNAEIERALVLFPSLDWSSSDGQFDIRRERSRMELSRALSTLGPDQIILQDTRDVNAVLLSSYLKGFDRVKEVISAESTTQQFEGPDFARHMDFVGDDSLAVYLRDLELQIPARQNLNDNIEIADCQGSDSPNPLHLAMIQDYLLKTHLIIYVLSSRTGIRQADIKFLSMIKRMGLMENIFFVVNCDFNEHEDLDDLQTLNGKIREDITVIKPDADIFTFSSLFDLFRAVGSDISEKDKQRMEQWEKETEIREFSDRERKLFEKEFYERLTRDRFTLLLKNHLERLKVMTSGLQDWVRLNMDLLSKDAADARHIVEKIEYEQKQLHQVKSMIRDTLDGAAQKTKRELETDINRFLDARFGDLVKDIQEFVRSYQVDVRNSEDDLDGMGFSATLYMVFQEFKHALDRYMTETINPRIIQFVRQDERKINDLLTTIAASYDTLVQDTLQRYEETLRNVGVQLSSQSSKSDVSFNMDTIKRMSGLSMPPLITSLQYTTRIRTDAIVRLGFYNFIKVMKKLFKKPIQNDKEGEIFALRDGIKRIKRETERSLVFHLGDYRENLKFQYIFKLVDVASNNLHDILLGRFQIFTSDISEMVELIDKQHEVKEKALEALAVMNSSLPDIAYHLDHLKGEMDF